MSSNSKTALFVTCSRPGLIRGNVAHPAVKAHAPDAFSEAQLREMLAEPAIAVIIGRRLLPDHLSDYLGATVADRTHLMAGSIETDAGASLATEEVAQRNALRDEVRRAEHVDELHAQAEALNAPGVDRVSTDTLPAGPVPAQTPEGADVALAAEVAAIEGAGVQETVTDEAALVRAAETRATRRAAGRHT